MHGRDLASHRLDKIGDAPSAILADGRVLLGDINGKSQRHLRSGRQHVDGRGTKDDARCTEETWLILPDQTVLAIECDNQPKAEKYIPASDKWVSAGTTPVTLVDTLSDEVGAAILLPDGRAFCIGATNHTALYTPPAIANQPGTWTAGPDFPVITTGRVTGAKDAPAALLPNGKVLCLVAPCDQSAASNTTPFWGSPVHFFEYDPATNTLTEVSAPTNSGGSPFSSRLMLLPTGEVLHTNNSTTVTIYTPDLAPDPVVAALDHVGTDRTSARRDLHAAWPAAQRAVAGRHLRRRRRDGHQLSDRALDQNRHG